MNGHFSGLSTIKTNSTCGCTPLKSARDFKFESEDDKKLEGAQVVRLDFDNPCPVENLFIFCVDGLKNYDDTEVADHIQVHLTGIPDKNDIKKYSAHLLGNGKGIVLQVPVIPDYMYKQFVDTKITMVNRLIKTKMLINGLRNKIRS